MLTYSSLLVMAKQQKSYNLQIILEITGGEVSLHCVYVA